MNQPGLLYLDRDDVASLLDLPDCIEAVEQAFRAHAEGRVPTAPAVLGTHLNDGGLHVKTAALGDDPCYVVAKVNANFPGNPERFGLPTIQGLLLLFDGRRGTPLAVMDSVEITILRTAAATGVAARYLARDEAPVVALLGCGAQARSQLRAVATVRPVRRALVVDVVPDQARRLAEELAPELGIAIEPVASVEAAVAEADLWITCTPARRPILSASMFRPGLFVAAVGADSPEKHEVDPAFLRAAEVVVDLVDQAAAMGDLHHALGAGVMTRDDIHAELGAIVAGRRPGRTSPGQTFVFDSTGTALQDVAAAALVYERARLRSRGTILAVPGAGSAGAGR